MSDNEPSTEKPCPSLDSLLDQRARIQAHHLVFEFYQRVGIGLANLNERGPARGMLSLAAYRTEQALGLFSPWTQDALNLLALHDYNGGDYASALAAFERLHASTRYVWGEQDRFTRIAKVRVWQCRRQLKTPLTSFSRAMGSPRPL